MAIESDQNGITEPAVSLTEATASDDGDDGEDSGEDAAPQQAAAPAKTAGKTGGGNRKDRRGAFTSATEQMRNAVMESVRGELGQFKTQFQREMETIRSAAQPARQQQAAGPSAHEKRMGEIQSALQAEMAAFGAHDPKKGQYDLTRYNSLKAEEQRIVARAEAAGMLREMGLTPEMLQRMREPQGAVEPAKDPVMVNRFMEVARVHPWINDNKNAMAVGTYKRYLFSIGRPDTTETDMEAAAHVASELGLSQQRAPRGNPSALTGIRGDGRGGGGGPRSVKLPAAAMNGLSADEMAMIKRDVFSGE